MVKNNKKVLGRGLNSLLGSDSYENDKRYSDIEISTNNKNEEVNTIPGEVKIRKVKSEKSNIDNSTINEDQQNILEVDIENVIANPNQPRTNFNQDELEELANSISRNGLLQPILVCNKNNGKYEVIAGERRLRACKIAGKKKVPIIIRDTDEEKKLELALIENIQREDLNPMEEAYSYKKIIETKGVSHAELATIVSKGRSTITNSLRLLDLPEKAQELLYKNKITAGHARAILSVTTNMGKEKLTNKIIDDKLTVRESEQLANLYNGQSTKALKTVKPTAPKSYKMAAKAIKEYLGNQVRVKRVKGKSKIEIDFNDERDLKRIIELILPNE